MFHVLIREGNKERIQVYAGTVIARKGTGATETFTVRRISHGVGVERVFSIAFAPCGKDRARRPSVTPARAKLYYLRDRVGQERQAARKQEEVKAALIEFEQEAWDNGASCIAGIDEAGRGPLAGTGGSGSRFDRSRSSRASG